MPTGTPVFDWTVPREWNIRDAWIRNPQGEKIVDFRKSNLHVVQYSVPVQGRLSLEELKPHLHTHRAQPDWVPYRTSYYKESWGFCLSQRQLERLEPGEYEVLIDSSRPHGLRATVSTFFVAVRVKRCFSPATPAIRRWPTTTCPAWRSDEAGPGAGGDRPPLFLPLSVHSGDDRLDNAWLPATEERTRQIRHGLVQHCRRRRWKAAL